MYTLEDTERIARDEITREAVRLYLMDKLIESFRELIDSADDHGTVMSNTLEDGLTAISNGLNDITDTAKELSEIRSALNEIVIELRDLNMLIESHESGQKGEAS